MGVLFSAVRYAGPIFRQSYPPEPEFSTSHIPDLSGRVVLVTGMHSIFLAVKRPAYHVLAGGNAGIGQETVRVLFHRYMGRLKY